MNVAVLGAGQLGRDVAELAATSGHAVNLHDETANRVMDGIDDVERRVGNAVDAGEMSTGEREEALDSLDGTTDREAAVADAEMVIQTETSDASELQAQFAEIEETVERETIIATSATGVSITAAAAGLRHPDRALGLYLRDPLSVDLVEVVVADQTAAETADRCVEFVEGLDRHPILVRDAPGNASPRLTLAQEAEAMRLVEDEVTGVPGADAALTHGYDHPEGPLERADRIGLEHRLETLEYLADNLGERFRPPTLLQDLVAAGRTGLRAGEGFYEWENGEATESALPDPEIPRREQAPDDPGR